MRLFVLGATGRTGVELVDLALARGHEVTAFVRSPQKLTRRAGLHVIQGDPRSADQMVPVLTAHDAVLSALGPTPREALTRTTLLRDCTSSTLTAMSSAGVRRLLVVSSALLFQGGGAVAGLIRILMRSHVRDLRAMEDQVKASSLEWTIARPPRLVDERADAYRAEVEALPAGDAFLAARLSWRAVAAFMIDAVSDGRFMRRTVGICR